MSTLQNQLQQAIPRLVRQLPSGLRPYVPRQVGALRIQPSTEEERRQSVQDRLPVDRIDSGVVFLKPGTTPRAVKILEVLPINFRLRSPFERRQILRSFAEFLNALKFPVQLRNHAELLDLSSYLAAVRERAQKEKNFHRRHALVSYGDFLEAMTRNKELVRRRFFLVIPYTGYTTDPDPTIIRHTLYQHALDLSERLQRCGLSSYDLDDVALANLLHAVLRPAYAVEQRITPEDLTADFLLNLIAPDSLEFGRDHFMIGDKFSRLLMVTGYKEEVREGWLSDLYSYSPKVAVIQHIEPTAADTLQVDLSNSLGEIRHRLSKGGLSPLEAKQYELKEKSGDYLLSQLASGSQQVLDFSMYIQVMADSMAELNDLTRKMEGMLGGGRLKTRRTSHRTQQAFDTCLPVSLNRLKETAAWEMPAETVSSTFPFDHAELSHTYGVLRGINKFTRNAVILDSYHPYLTNPHEVAICTSGGGKTIEMKATLDRSHALGDRIFALDIEREYHRLCKARGGQWINLAPGAGNIINPMEIRPSALSPDGEADPDGDVEAMRQQLRAGVALQPPREDANPLLAAIQRQQTLFGLMLPSITEEQMAYVEEEQFEVYQQAGINEATDVGGVPRDAWPHLGHLAARLQGRAETRALGAQLRRWVDGSLQGIISGHSTVDLDSSFVVLGIHDLEGMPRAQPPILYAALTYLWDEIRRDRSERKTLAVDEMGLLKENQQALWFLWMLAKRARKYGCRLKCATQQVADFVKAGYYAEAIIGNAETKVLGRQKETDLIALKSLIPFSEQEVSLLSNTAPEDKLLMVGNQRVLITVECSLEELKVYDSKAYARKSGNGGTA